MAADRVRRFGRVRVTFIALTLVVAVVAFNLEPPSTLLSVSLQTEVVKVRVVRTDFATMLLPVAAFLHPEDDREECLQGVVIRPAVGSTVVYARKRGQDLMVSVTGRASWTDQGGPRQSAEAESESPRFRVSARKAACRLEDELRVRLPVSGVADFGDLPRPVTDEFSEQLTLISGDMTVYGRAISSLFGVPLPSTPFQPDALFLVQNLKIPGGSRIVVADQGDVGHASGGTGLADRSSRWQGFADLAFGGEGNAMAVEASTTARRVLLFSPAGGRGNAGQEPDVVSLSLGARLVRDPNVAWIYGLLALLGAVFGLKSHFDGGAAAATTRRKEKAQCTASEPDDASPPRP